MKMELSQRDVRLLEVMVAILIVVICFRFLIIPQYQNRQDLLLELETVQDEQDMMQAQIDRIPTLEIQRSNELERYKELSDEYYDVLANLKIDEIVTNLASKHDLFPNSLSIGNTSSVYPGAYLYSSAGNKSSSPVIEASTDSYFTSTQVAFSVTGSQENVRSFLDDLEENQNSIQLRSFSIQYSVYLNANLEVENAERYDIVLTFFECDKESVLRN